MQTKIMYRNDLALNYPDGSVKGFLAKERPGAGLPLSAFFSPPSDWIIITELLRLIMEGTKREIHGQNNHFYMVYCATHHPLTHVIGN